MEVLIEFIQFFALSFVIVLISKYALVTLLRKLAETLNLSPKAVGNIAGVATSVPELLTVSFSAFAGLVDTSVFNILSSNIINFVQYIISISLNKNRKGTQNKAIKIDLWMVGITILIPILMLMTGIETSVSIVPIFFLLFVFCFYLNHNSHKLYLKKQEETLGEPIRKETRWLKGKRRKTLMYVVLLGITGIGLYIVGNALSIVLSRLCKSFGIPEWILGILLGFITSIPELITFFESQKHYNSKENEELGIVEATNNLLSSNLLNLFFIQSIGILIYHMVK